jgi:hypothetical protein
MVPVPGIYAYRKLMLALSPVVYSGLAVLLDAINKHPGQLWQLTWANVAVAVATAAAVYFPSASWAKALGGLAGAVGATVVASLTDGAVTPAEGIQIVMQVLVFVGAGTIPNEPTK